MTNIRYVLVLPQVCWVTHQLLCNFCNNSFQFVVQFRRISWSSHSVPCVFFIWISSLFDPKRSLLGLFVAEEALPCVIWLSHFVQTQCHSCVMPVQLFLSSYFPLCDFLRTSLLVADQDLRSLCGMVGVLVQFRLHLPGFVFWQGSQTLMVFPWAKQMQQNTIMI